MIEINTNSKKVKSIVNGCKGSVAQQSSSPYPGFSGGGGGGAALPIMAYMGGIPFQVSDISKGKNSRVEVYEIVREINK